MDEFEPEDENGRPGFAMPGIWLLLAISVSLLCCAGVGFAISKSESQGMNASMLASFPVGFLLSGLAAALVTHFVARHPAVRAFAPLGCGCFGGLGLFAVVFLFFAVIFPSL